VSSLHRYLKEIILENLSDSRLIEVHQKLIYYLEKANDLDSEEGAITWNELVVYDQIIKEIEKTGRVSIYQGRNVIGK